MGDRIVDIAEQGGRLRVQDRQFVFERAAAPGDAPREARIPLADLAAVVASNPQLSLSQPLLAEMADAGVALVVCDSAHLPCGLYLPLVGHSTQAERMARQVEAKLPVRKRLWQSLVRAKIRAQAELLRRRRETDCGLDALARRVRSGDPDNVEAQAARRYWPALFGDPEFRRVREGLPPNGLLNYGYAVLRAIVARAVVAAGLHPSVGLHHHNRYDAFCLADDLMEPLRPVVDAAVAAIVDERGMDTPVGRDTKRELLEPLLGTVNLDDEQRSLFDAAERTAVSLARVFEGQREDLLLPRVTL
jgi:CRISPR-associated protein Cas1